MNQASTTTAAAAFAFSLDARAQLAAWIEPREPWGFRLEVAELEAGGSEVAMVFAPGRPGQFHAMISSDAQGGAMVMNEAGDGEPVAGMAAALEAITAGLVAGIPRVRTVEIMKSGYAPV